MTDRTEIRAGRAALVVEMTNEIEAARRLFQDDPTPQAASRMQEAEIAYREFLASMHGLAD